MILDNVDKTNRNGLIQLLEDETGTQNGNSYPKATKVRDINLGLNDFMFIAMKAANKWHIDDTNQTDYAIIETNIISGRQDYPFLNDGSTTPNQILDIYRVEIADQFGNFTEITQLDVEGIQVALSEYKSDGGVPTEYNKDGNSIKLYAIPNYSYTRGLRMYINRTPSYFISTDTTKEPGIPQWFHPYLVYSAAYRYCSQKGLPQAGGRLRNGAYTGLAAVVQQWEQKIGDYYSDRSRDVRRSMTVRNDSNK